MSTLQQDGRIAIAMAVAAMPIHFAIGRGTPAWDAAPVPEPNNAAALVDEIARRQASQVLYCLPDPNGEIEMASGNYTVSAQPTTYLLCRFIFNFGEAAGETVREHGLFVGTTIKASVPAGQRYFQPADVETTGRLYTLERVSAYPRSASVRQLYERVLPF